MVGSWAVTGALSELRKHGPRNADNPAGVACGGDRQWETSLGTWTRSSGGLGGEDSSIFQATGKAKLALSGRQRDAHFDTRDGLFDTRKTPARGRVAVPGIFRLVCRQSMLLWRLAQGMLVSFAELDQ